MFLGTAPTMEHLVNSYIDRALRGPEQFHEVSKAFGGLDMTDAGGVFLNRRSLADAIARRVLRQGWQYEVVQQGDGSTRIVITGRT